MKQGFSLEPIRFTSFLGDNALDIYRQISAHIERVTGLPTEFISGIPPAEQEALVQREAIQVVFTCGLPYVKKADHTPPLLRLLAAPVLSQPRYHNQPIYYSDVIVRAASPYHTLADLRGSRFVYNEPHSFSGYMLPWYHLRRLGEDEDLSDFFKESVPSGSHARSMDWVEQGLVDVAAIDSVIFDMEMAQRPARAAVFRVIERLGPNPMPPVAAVRGLSKDCYDSVQTALLSMHIDNSGRTILEQAGLKRFAAVADSDYDPLRRIMDVLSRTC